MTKHLKHFLKGVGSVMDIAPASNFDRFVPRRTEDEMLRADLNRIGSDMKRVLEAQHVNTPPQLRK